jgi:hypothetical protein
LHGIYLKNYTVHPADRTDVIFDKINGQGFSMNFWRSRYGSRLKLSEEELLNISQEITNTFAPSVSDTTPELVVLPIDPYHIHAYWNLVDKFAATSGYSFPDTGLTLRIYWHPDGCNGTVANRLWFDVTLQSIQQQCNVQVPIDDAVYSVAIGQLAADHSLNIFAHSDNVRVPRAQMAPPRSEDEDIQPHFQRVKQADHTLVDGCLQDETLVDLTIKDILSAREALGVSAISACGEEFRALYDEIRIAAAIKQILHAKGIRALPFPEMQEPQERIPPRKTLSGRGNLR